MNRRNRSGPINGPLAARHLIELGFEHFAYTGQSYRFETERLAGFAEVLVQAGHGAPARVSRGDAANPAVLAALPAPVGIFASTDRGARVVADACRRAGLVVPDQVAVMGTDEDDLYCEACRPHITSIDPAGRAVGFAAAALIERLVLGAPRPRAPILVPPGGVVQRESTAKRATDDPLLIRSLHYIREHAIDGITISDVARAVGANRKALQRRYRATFGDSLRGEIRRVQLACAQRLLAETDMKIVDVATAAGFPHAGRFAATFGDCVGETPAAFRRRRRLR